MLKLWKLVTDPLLKQAFHNLNNYMKEKPKLKILNVIKNQKKSVPNDFFIMLRGSVTKN